MHYENVLGGILVGFEKKNSNKISNSMFFIHSQNVLGGLLVSFEKSEIGFVFWFLMYSQNVLCG